MHWLPLQLGGYVLMKAPYPRCGLFCISLHWRFDLGCQCVGNIWWTFLQRLNSFSEGLFGHQLKFGYGLY